MEFIPLKIKGSGLQPGTIVFFLNSGDTLYNENVLLEVMDSGMDSDIVYGDMMIDDGIKKVKGCMPDQLTFGHMIKDTLWHPVCILLNDPYLINMGCIGRI